MANIYNHDEPQGDGEQVSVPSSPVDILDDGFDIEKLPSEASVEGLEALLDKADRSTGIVSWDDVLEQLGGEGTEDGEIEDTTRLHIASVIEGRGFVISGLHGDGGLSESLKIGNSALSSTSTDSIRHYNNQISRYPQLNSAQVTETMRRVSETYVAVCDYAIGTPCVAARIYRRWKELDNLGSIMEYRVLVDSVGTNLKMQEEGGDAPVDGGDDAIPDDVSDNPDAGGDSDTDEDSKKGAGPYGRKEYQFAAPIFENRFGKWDEFAGSMKENSIGEPVITKSVASYFDSLRYIVSKVQINHNFMLLVIEECLGLSRQLKSLDGKFVVAAGKKDRSSIPVVKKLLAERSNARNDAKLRKLTGMTDGRFNELMGQYRNIAQSACSDLVRFRKDVVELRRLTNDWVTVRNLMINSNLRLVVSMASQRYRNNNTLEMADIIQEGNIGLFQTVDKFDYRKGYKFSTYAVKWIDRQIKKAIMEKGTVVRVPGHMHDADYKIRTAAQNFMVEHNRSPTIEELARKTRLPAARIEKSLHAKRRLVSLDMRLSNNGDDSGSSATIGDMLGDRQTPSPLNVVAGKQREESVDEALSTLDAREERVLRMRFGIGCNEDTLDNIGAIFGVTRERIRQIETKALKKLSRPLRGRIIRDHHHYDSDGDGNEES